MDFGQLRGSVRRARESVLGRGRGAQPGPEVAAILSWLRNLALDGDTFVLETPAGRELLAFPFPSYPGVPPTKVAGGAAEPRFHLRAGGPAGSPPGPGFRAVVRLRAATLWERDAPHGTERPLRLGLGDGEGRAILAHVRCCSERVARDQRGLIATPATTGDLARLGQRSVVAVAVWTRGRLRGSVVSPAGPALQALGRLSVFACQDARFARLSPGDLADTVFEATLIDAPRIPVTRAEIDACDAYPDKGVFLSEGTRLGIYLPEIFNVGGARKLSALTASLARDKAGLDRVGPATLVEVCDVTDVIESKDHARVVTLDGPVARAHDLALRPAAEAAAAWLGRLQEEDGALPQRVRVATGEAVGRDVVRAAMTAHALAEAAAAFGLGSARETARRAFEWATKAGDGGADGALLSAYLGKAAWALSGPAAAAPFVADVLARVRAMTAEVSPLLGAHVVSFLGLVAKDDADAAAVCARLASDLEARFDRARGEAGASMSLAEWAELAMAPAGSAALGARVKGWLAGQQLASGAFPDSTTSSFAYSRGTGKVFEVLADGATSPAAAAALPWLLAMQYRDDSAFFIPFEHHGRAIGGLRHDAYDTDAWIDAAGHLLLGLARLAPR